MTTPTQQIVVGVLSERAAGERRVALIPADIKKSISSATFVIEGGAGIDPKTSMLFGDARQSLLDLALQVKVA